MYGKAVVVVIVVLAVDSAKFVIALKFVVAVVVVVVIHCVSKKTASVFFNSSVKHWPIQIIFRMEHREDTWRK